MNPTQGSENIAALVLASYNTPPPDIAAVAAKYFDNSNPKYSLGKGIGFPTERRLELRPLAEISLEIIKAWVASSGITVGPGVDIPERVK